ncbi:F-box domain-containingprotein [Purpureocillium lilacinum]|uniref:F-box domain-containingprotein n=1 Tax=Purpureocillium lilacinum TaxID=33203 RepID=A0A179HL84_PURLI|nr:F-box domain-containingprotein [Purpureocillium lilacinum]OAQ90764.1 F-box domain-containingprotein [Purpureocillium lilacinum]
MPVEILLEIYHHLDIGAIFELSVINRSFFNFYLRRKATILLPVLERDFSPFDELLQVYTASVDDVDVKDGLYRPRRVIFKRFVGDAGLTLTKHASFPKRSTEITGNGFTRVDKSHRAVPLPELSQKTSVLTEDDLSGILKHCRLVLRWEELFPQMRWFNQPEDCRFLRPHESFRFRRALYRWWLYGVYFHGEFPRPRVGHPEPHVDDIRTSQMRHHSTAELLELMDFLETIKDVILHYICPRLDPSQNTIAGEVAPDGLADRSHSLATSWMDQSRWGRVIKTYAKLGPEELLYYFDNIYSYPRKRLITEIRLQHPSFTFDQESIQIAVRCALDERHWTDKNPSLAEDGCGGIIDFDDERDEQRGVFKYDGSPDGSLPQGARSVQSYSRYSPRGDDGSFMDDYYRLSGFEARLAGATALDAVV